MKKGRNTSVGAAELRRMAKARLRAAATKGDPAPTEAGTQRLLHELQVHQLELEMQNQELRGSRAEVESLLERYTELYDFAPVGYVTLGRDGAVHQVNLTGARLLGIERARLVGRPFGVFVEEPDRAGFQAFLGKVFASQAKEVCEVALREEGKGLLHVQLTATVSQGGQECRVMMADITEHKRTLKMLRDSEQRLQHALDATAEGVWDWNIRTGDVLFSRNWKTSLGYSPDEVPDRVEFWESIIHPEDLPRVRQALDDYFAGRSPLYVCENRLRMKSGEYRANLDRGKVVERDASGQPVRMVGTDTDIRERRKVLEGLQQAKDNLDAIFNAIQQAVFFMDTDGVVINANTELARRLNMRVEEIVGASIYDLLPDDVASRRRRYVEEVIRTRQAVRFEDTRAGRIISQSLYPVFDSQGNVIRLAVYGEDVTEQRRSEQVLQESEEKYRLLFENSLDGILITVPDGTILDVNPAACAMLGMSRDEVCRAGREGIVESNATLAASLRERERTGSAKAELTYVHKDGSTFIGETSSVVTANQCGTKRAFVIVRDITERKRVEQALRESEESYRRIVETASEGIWSMDGGYRTTYVNRRMADMLGYAPEEMVGRRVDAFMFAEDMGDHSAKMAIRTKGEGGAYERRFRRKDGRELWTIVAATALKDAEGNFAGSFAMFTDVTDRKQAEQSLLESEVRYRIVADNTYDWECWFNPDGKFLYSSPSCERITGYTAGDFLRRPSLMREIVHPDDRMSWDAHRCGNASNQRAVEFELRVIRADGETRWIDHICQPVFDPAGKFLGSRASNRDTTDRKQGEEALQAYENIVSSSPDAMSLVDRNYVYKTANDTYLYRTGLARDRIVGRPVAEVMGQAVFDEIVKPRLDRSLAGETVTYSEWFDFPAQGRKHVEVTYTPCRNRESEVIGAVVVARDITERKVAEEATARSQAVLNRTQQLAGVGGWEWDVETPSMFWTEETYRIHDLVPGELVPGSAEHVARSLACYDAPDRPRIMEAFRRCAEEGEAYDIEFPFTSAKGRRMWVRTIAEAVLDRGRVARVVGNIMDITERKRLEEILQARLRLSEAAGTLSLSDLLQQALDETERLTGSCIGFFHFVEEDQRTLSLQTWSTNPLEKMCTAEGKGRHYGVDEAGVWVECVRERRPVIHNDYSALPHRKGLPAGHAPIVRELAVPILRNDRVVAVLGVGNKPQDYSERDVETVESLANLAWDIVLRKKMERDLRQSHVELRDLYRQLQNAREEERRRISREIHDELGQNITAMQIDLAWLKKKIDPVRPDLLDKLDAMNQIAESTLATVRRVSAELRPGILDALGLPAAVEWLVRDFEKRSEIPCSLLIEPEEIEVEQNLATDVFRVLQEALTNVVRHARASALQVRLRQIEGMLELEVADDGIGFSGEEISRPGSLGLLGIRERLLVHGGDITMRRLPGQGTCLSAVIPTQSKGGLK